MNKQQVQRDFLKFVFGWMVLHFNTQQVVGTYRKQGYLQRSHLLTVEIQQQILPPDPGGLHCLGLYRKASTATGLFIRPHEKVHSSPHRIALKITISIV